MCMSCLCPCALHRRQMHGASEDDVPVPPLLKTALVWGLFMGVSSNLRYQVRVDGRGGDHQSGSVAMSYP